MHVVESINTERERDRESIPQLKVRHMQPVKGGH